MQVTPRQSLLQFAHVLQQDLFPGLETALGPLSPAMKLLSSTLTLLPLDRFLDPHRALTGRPAKDRKALAVAFIAKAILNLSCTRDLIERLQVDAQLRQLCGWSSAASVPHESKFSRVFARFAVSEFPQQLHQALIEATQKDRLIGHIARDSTAIAVRERFPEAPDRDKNSSRSSKSEKRRKSHRGRKSISPAKAGKKAASKPKPRKGKCKATERGTRIQRQRYQSASTMLAEIPKHCDLGVKTSSQGNQQYWRGYKLHLDVADGQIPISALLSSASTHDSQVAIPLMTVSSQRVRYLYELMDSAYDADAIHEHSRQLQHVPIIAPHSRRAAPNKSQLPKIFPPKEKPQLCPAQQARFRTRTMVERVNARLKEEFGASQIRVRGAAKVMAHLMFGVVALTVDQWLRLSG